MIKKDKIIFINEILKQQIMVVKIDKKLDYDNFLDEYIPEENKKNKKEIVNISNVFYNLKIRCNYN